MNISFLGINESIVTFKTQGDISKGDLVSVCADGTVKKATEDSDFVGVCTSSNATVTAVQVAGFAHIPIVDATDLSYGINHFIVSNAASLKLSASPDKKTTPLQVVSIDKEKSVIGVFLR